MDEDEFWRLADLAGQDAIQALVAELTGRGGAEIVAFHERLRTAMAALDTAEHRGQPVGDVSGGALLPPSEDTFEDLRGAVVAAGRQRWQAAVADPATLSGRWPLALGEEFAVAAAQAYEIATGDPWPNLGLSTPHDPDAPGALPPATLQGWLMILIDEHSVPGGLPEAYLVQVRWLEQVLDVEEWWRRWNTARGRESQVDCYLDHGAGRTRRTSTHVGTDFAGRDQVTVRVRLPMPSVERPDLDPAGDGTGWAALAREHVEVLLNVLEAKFGMQRPVLPDPAELERRPGRRGRPGSRGGGRLRGVEPRAHHPGPEHLGQPGPGPRDRRARPHPGERRPRPATGPAVRDAGRAPDPGHRRGRRATGRRRLQPRRSRRRPR